MRTFLSFPKSLISFGQWVWLHSWGQSKHYSSHALMMTQEKKGSKPVEMIAIFSILGWWLQKQTTKKKGKSYSNEQNCKVFTHVWTNLFRFSSTDRLGSWHCCHCYCTFVLCWSCLVKYLHFCTLLSCPGLALWMSTLISPLFTFNV